MSQLIQVHLLSEKKLGKIRADELIDSNRLGFYRLNTSPRDVQIDKSILSQNPEAEVRKWIEEL